MEQSFEATLGREIVARRTVGGIYESILNDKMDQRGVDMLAETLCGVHIGIMKSYQQGEFAALEGDQGIMIIATDTGALVSRVSVGGLYADEELFANAIEFEDSDYWGIIHQLFKDEEKEKLCLAVALKLGREKVKLWLDHIRDGKKDGTTPVLIALANCQDAPEAKMTDISGLITVAGLPIEPPDLSEAVAKAKEIAEKLFATLADDDDDDEGEAPKVSIH